MYRLGRSFISKMKYDITIPGDEDGFIQMKCPPCGDKFMISIDDYENEDLIELWCPQCGLIHESYIDDDIEELANRIIENSVKDLLNGFSKDLEKTFKNNEFMKVKEGKKLKKEAELPIGRKFSDLTVKYFKCCNKDAKVSLQQEFSGCYCPFCGELYIDEDK